MKKLLLLLAVAFCLNGRAQITNLLDFNSTNGKYPEGSLISDGTYLYGTTEQGGAHGYGVIFKIKPDGTGYTDLFDFNGINGGYPVENLISDGTYLYGMSKTGGININGNGAIFKIKPDGTGFQDLFLFNGTNGAQPNGSLISDGTYLYGMTYLGGTPSPYGNIFKIKPDGTGFDTLMFFNGITGGKPYGSLISDGTYLYGMASEGGTNVDGTIFKIKTDGTGFTKLHDFSGTTDGALPGGALISDGIYIYGTTYSGGANNDGVIFKIKPDGTGFTKLLDFSGIANGASPNGTLISDGTYLYGMTYQGGVNNDGLVFKIKPDGTGYTDLFDFNGTNGTLPHGSLMSDGTYLYGTAYQGGANNDGVIFKLQIPCQNTTTNNPQTICAGSNYTFNGHAYTTAGTYTDTLQSIGGCEGIIITQLTVNPLPTVSVSPQSPVYVCQGGTGTNLYASGANTYTWSQSGTATPPTPLSPFDWDSVSVNPPGIPSPIETYSVVGTNSVGCTSPMVVLTVSVQPKPVPIYSPNDTMCVGLSATLSVTGMPTNATYHWGAAFGSGLGSNAGPVVQETPIYYNPSHGFADTTIVDTVIVHVPGCPNYVPHLIHVVVEPKAVTSFTLSQDAAPFTWDAYPTYSPNVISAVWNWGDGSSTNGLYPSHTYSAAGSYSICVNVSNGFCNTNYCQSDSVYRLATNNSTLNNMVYVNVLNGGAGINQLAVNNNQVTVYPNPNNGIFNLTMSQFDNLKTNRIEIYNINGECVHRQIATSSNCQINLNNLAEGVYNLSVISNNGVVNKRLVIVR